MTCVNHLCRSYEVLERGAAHNRKPSCILGLLLKHHFPGIVTPESLPEPAWTWGHYAVAPDQPDVLGRVFNNKAVRVLNM